MNEQVWWYVARSTGIVAWFLLAAGVIWGLLGPTRMLDRWARAAWVLDLHRWLGALAVVFTGFHLGGLVADSYLHFGWREITVPFASSWKPLAVALGVVALWLLVAVQATSLAMRRLPRRVWKYIHLSSYLLFASSTAHLLAAGTDSHNPLLQGALVAACTLVAALTLLRVLPVRERHSSNRPAAGRPAPGRPAALDR
jgi:DMSO/TMAO reductase YedYZ heme-binding membrane subunit